MFDRIPLEIIINITTFLTYRDKLTLSLTNKRLRLIIWNNTLFQKLSLHYSSNEKQRAVLEYFKNKKMFGQQVKQLTMTSSVLSDDLVRDLALVFPNVTDLEDESSGLTISQQTKKSSDMINTMIPWKDTLQILHTDDEFSQLFTLIEKNVFSKLTYLSISPYEHYNLVEKPAVNLFQCLTNAPSLVHLRLFNMTVHIQFLEELHTRFPQLQSLTLDSLIINTKKDIEFSSLEPASCLLSLKVEDSVLICDERCFFLDYIITKYRNLKKLVISSTLDMNREDLGCSSLYFCGADGDIAFSNLHNVEDNERNMQLLEEITNDYSITQQSYNREGSKRFLKLPRTLKKMEINTSIFKDLPESLKRSNIQLKTLCYNSFWSTNRTIHSSQQIEFFQKWTSLTTLEITMSNDFKPGSSHFISSGVKTLKLRLLDENSQQDYFIDCILASFPSVNSLSVKHAFNREDFIITLCTDQNHAAASLFYPNLRYLYVECTQMDPKVSTFLSHNVPNLQELIVNLIVTRLSLILQKTSYSPVHTILLDNIRLQKLTIYFYNTHFIEDYNGYWTHSSKYQYVKVLKGLAYLLVQHQNQSNRYTFFKDLSFRYINLSLVDDIEVNDMNDRVQILLSYTGTIKEIFIGDCIMY